jgi:DNA-binding transcriptional LysR family regulator
MDIHHLKVFASVFRHKSFSKAAEELSLTQPTVSDHIKALERELDCRLFDRLSRKILPTEEARALIGRAQEIIDKTERFKDILLELKEDLSGHFIIGASTIPGTYILPGLTSSFRKKHPAVLFEIVVSDSREIINKVAEHELLIGIVGAKLDVKQLHYEPFLDDELIVIAPDSFKVEKSIDINELSAFPIVMREQGSGTRREFEKILEREAVDLQQLNIAGVFGSTDAVKQAVKEGMGISIISRRAVMDELKLGFLRELRLVDAGMKRQFYVVTHRKRTLPHLYRMFQDYLRS